MPSNALQLLNQRSVESLRSWLSRWSPEIGHRRSGRLIVAYPKLDPWMRGRATGMNRTPRQMRGAATEEEKDALMPLAAEELSRVPAADVLPVVSWWKVWYTSVGHKKLSRMLLEAESAKSPMLRGCPTDQVSSSSGVTLRPVGATNVSNLKVRFTSGDIDDPSIFSTRLRGAEIGVVLNKNHPMYERLAPLLERSEANGDVHCVVALLLESWARFEFEQTGESGRRLASTRADWGRVLRRMLVPGEEPSAL